jgi:hypothetical protein
LKFGVFERDPFGSRPGATDINFGLGLCNIVIANLVKGPESAFISSPFRNVKRCAYYANCFCVPLNELIDLGKKCSGLLGNTCYNGDSGNSGLEVFVLVLVWFFEEFLFELVHT